MKIISWNVNGLRAVLTKGFEKFLYDENPDIICIQETKMQEEQVAFNLIGYDMYFNSAEKKGYSGTSIFTKIKPLNVTYNIGVEEFDNEGRIITMEFDDFFLINNYTPNSKRELERIDYRMKWQDEILKYIKNLETIKPVIMCGDLNVAHQEIDIKNPKTNHHSAGFTDEERNKMTELLSSGFIDTYRYLYKDKVEYTWWSYMMNARAKNIGWRIDYFVMSDTIKEKLNDASIYTDTYGSDHCPIGIDIF